MIYGLSNEDLQYVVAKISEHDEINKAVIFGSRAKGDYKNNSDVDIALWGENITLSIISRIHADLEDLSLMPYMFDVIHYEKITNEKLSEHINCVGKIIYERGMKDDRY